MRAFSLAPRVNLRVFRQRSGVTATKDYGNLFQAHQLSEPLPVLRGCITERPNRIGPQISNPSTRVSAVRGLELDRMEEANASLCKRHDA